jgi:hypothetical protein
MLVSKNIETISKQKIKILATAESHYGERKKNRLAAM